MANINGIKWCFRDEAIPVVLSVLIRSCDKHKQLIFTLVLQGFDVMLFLLRESTTSLDIYLYTTQSKLCFTINFISGRTKGEQLASGNASKSTAKYE